MTLLGLACTLPTDEPISWTAVFGWHGCGRQDSPLGLMALATLQKSAVAVVSRPSLDHSGIATGKSPRTWRLMRGATAILVSEPSADDPRPRSGCGSIPLSACEWAGEVLPGPGPVEKSLLSGADHDGRGGGSLSCQQATASST